MAPVKTGAYFFCALLSLIMGAGGAIFVLYVRDVWPTNPDEAFATLFTGIAAAVIGTIAVIVAVWGTISARKIARSQTTFQHLAATEADGSFQKARIKFAEIVRAGDIAKYAEQDQEGHADTQAIVSVLNEYELLSVGIQRGIIDGELFKRLSRSSVIYDWESSQPFVLALRKRTGRAILFHEFEEMAGWMSHDKLPRRRFWWAGL